MNKAASPNTRLLSYSALQSLVLDSAAKGSDCPHVLIYSLSFCKHTEELPSVQPNRSHDTSPHGQVAFCKYSTNSTFPEAAQHIMGT